jgi:hypothetical protein|tara:strand:- start:51 stop:422 length:372 start_codon:yes stop_codon:yes gene_type:complete
MKYLLFICTLFISSIGFAQTGYWYDVLYEVKSKNTKKFTSIVNEYYSNIKIPDDIEGEFSTLIFKGSNEKSIQLISFSTSSSKSLAEFKESLSGPDWDIYSAELFKNVESEYALQVTKLSLFL